MPEVLAGVEEAAIASWSVAIGDTVGPEDVVAEVETDKAVVDLPAGAFGTIGQFCIEPGVTVPVGTVVLVLLADGESAEDADVAAAVDAARETEPMPQEDPAEVLVAEPDAGVAAPSGGRLFVSPLARKLAREHGLALADLPGTGPNGRITKRDVLRAAVARPARDSTDVPVAAATATSQAASVAPAPAPARAAPSAPRGFTVTPHSSMRRAIARHLTESKQQIPHFYLKADCTVDNLLALRREINAAARRKISVNDLVIKAVGLAFARLPEANVGWTDEGIVRYAQSDICVAVSTGDGLLTPVVRDVAGRSLTSVSEDIADLAERSRAGRLKQAELEGGTFTVSNLGMHGVSEFSAIINPPQAGILAVGAATQRAVVKDGGLGVATVMTVTLSADHRVLDGELGARWLADFVGLLESPMQLLV